MASVAVTSSFLAVEAILEGFWGKSVLNQKIAIPCARAELHRVVGERRVLEDASYL